jgi:hypothetical protein
VSDKPATWIESVWGTRGALLAALYAGLVAIERDPSLIQRAKKKP